MSNNNLVYIKSVLSSMQTPIIITGVARSGTTIIGKIIHSFDRVEYAFEPPTYFSLFPLIDSINENHWKLLFETYLYEEILINSICGRSINCNISDDSSIYQVKSKELINKRLNYSIRKEEALNKAFQQVVAFKMPDIAPYLKTFINYYPSYRIILTKRKAEQVFSSLLKKKWFSNESLMNGNLLYPARLVRNIAVPFWVAENDIDYWVNCDELHRVAYYYIRMHEEIEQINSLAIIDYDDLVDNPYFVTSQLAEKLCLNFGERTNEIVSSVERKTKNVNKALLYQLDKNVQEKVISLSD